MDTNLTKSKSSRSSRKPGGIHLVPGVKSINMISFYLGAYAGILMSSFTPQAQALILNAFLKIPESQQGVLSGNLTFIGEIIIILSIGFLGALSDKIGRRVIFSGGFLLCAVGLLLYPSVNSILEIYVFRAIFALGSAAIVGMLSTVIADYVINADRGRVSGVQGIMNGLGAVTGLGIINMPAALQAGGMTAVEAIRTIYYIVAGIGIVTAIILFFGLQGRTNLQREQRNSILTIIRQGLKAARDPGIALSYAAAFVSRGDMAIVGTFLVLWGTIYGTSKLGLDVTIAASRAAMPMIVAQSIALVSAPLFGIMTDRVNRVTALTIALLITALGFTSTIFITNPYGPMMYISAFLMGMGQIGGVITSGVLIAQQAPQTVRGSVIGFFGLAGAVGILAGSTVGGYLFDNWLPAAPLFLFGVLAFLVMLWSLVIKPKVIPPTDVDQKNADTGE